MIQQYLSMHVERGRNSARRMHYDYWSSRLSWIPGLDAAQKLILSSFKGLGAWLDAGPAVKVVLPQAWAARISDYYRESNARLAERTKLDLGRYGYPLK
jgi:hypothetical protein